MLIRYLCGNSLLTKILVIVLFISQYLPALAEEVNNKTDDQHHVTTKKTLLNGWYPWKPYQFYEKSYGGGILTGMDINILQRVSENIGVRIEYEEVEWQQHQLDIKEGRRDIASGVTYTKAREQYAYFSIPYRFEENSLFVNAKSDKNLNFRSTDELLKQIKSQEFKLGVT